MSSWPVYLKSLKRVNVTIRQGRFLLMDSAAGPCNFSIMVVSCLCNLCKQSTSVTTRWYLLYTRVHHRGYFKQKLCIASVKDLHDLFLSLLISCGKWRVMLIVISCVTVVREKDLCCMLYIRFVVLNLPPLPQIKTQINRIKY